MTPDAIINEVKVSIFAARRRSFPPYEVELRFLNFAEPT